LPITNSDCTMLSTTSPSPSASSKDLAVYLDYVEFWDPDCGDAFAMLNAREAFAAAPAGSLSATEQETLMRADARLLALAEAAVGDTDDVEFLRLTAQAVMAQQSAAISG
jgi:hypothetical protein